MKSLESILQEYFNCQRPFNDNGKLSINGEYAYGRLVALLYDINNLVEININDFIDELDKLAPSDMRNTSIYLDKNGNKID